MLKRRLGKTALVLAMAGMLSCNLFEDLGPKDSRENMERHGPHSVVLDARLLMMQGEYHQARRMLEEVVGKTDTLSEAWFYLGKCYLRIDSVDLNDVWDEINPDREDSTDLPFLFSDPNRGLTDPLPAPFTLTIDGTPYTAGTVVDSVFLQRKRVYDAVSRAFYCLEMIHSNQASDGIIRREQYEPDYLIEVSVKTALGICDFNNNDTLDYNSTERDVFRWLCEGVRSIEDFTFDSLQNLSRDPKEINRQLDAVIALVSKADTSFDLFKEQLVEGARQTDKIQADMADDLGEMIFTFEEYLPYFYYNDFSDNDSDSYDSNGNNRKDRMIWIDWDGDDMIDVFDPSDPTTVEMHIGEAAHMNHTDYNRFYQYVDSRADTSTARFQRYRYTGPYTWEFIGGDWGIDEEILDGEDNDLDGIPDEDTRIHADTLDDDGDWYNTDTTPLRDDVYNPMVWSSSDNLDVDIAGAGIDSVAVNPLFLATFSLVLEEIPSMLPRYTGTHANGGDFTAGDYGLDEEWYDGYDNDNDGLVDEDVGERLPPIGLRDALIQYLSDNGLRGKQ